MAPNSTKHGIGLSLANRSIAGCENCGRLPETDEAEARDVLDKAYEEALQSNATVQGRSGRSSKWPNRFGIMGDEQAKATWNARTPSAKDSALVAAAPAAATTSSTTGERRRGFRRSTVAGSVRGAKDRQLDRVLLAGAVRAGNLLRLVEHDLLKVGLAIVADVFVDRHRIAPLRSLLLPLIIAKASVSGRSKAAREAINSCSGRH